MPARQKYKKRPDGRFLAQVSIGVKADGKPIRKNIYAATIKELEEKTAEFRRNASVKTSTPINRNVTLAKWAVEWFDTYKSSNAYKTREMYLNALNAHIIPELGSMRLNDLCPHHIQKFLNAKGQTHTSEILYQTLSQLLKVAAQNNIIDKNPAETVTKPRAPKSKKRALTDIEKKCITAADLDLKARAFILVLLYAGLRRGEALALAVKDVDLSKKTITINKTLLHINNQPEIKHAPKSEAGFREIPLPDVLIDVLAQYIPTLQAEVVFPAVKGGYMSQIAFRRFWDKIKKAFKAAAGESLASDLSPHIFRHTYATSLYYAGVDIKTAQYLLGHATLSVTMEIYTHLDTTKTSSAADKLNAYIQMQS